MWNAECGMLNEECGLRILAFCVDYFSIFAHKFT